MIKRRFLCSPRLGVAGHFEVVTDDSRLTAQSKQLLGNRLQVALLAVFQHAQCETTQASHVLVPMIGWIRL